jgi:hypothetical protein
MALMLFNYKIGIVRVNLLLLIKQIISLTYPENPPIRVVQSSPSVDSVIQI